MVFLVPPLVTPSNLVQLVDRPIYIKINHRSVLFSHPVLDRFVESFPSHLFIGIGQHVVVDQHRFLGRPRLRRPSMIRLKTALFMARFRKKRMFGYFLEEPDPLVLDGIVLFESEGSKGEEDRESRGRQFHHVNWPGSHPTPKIFHPNTAESDHSDNQSDL